MFYAGYAIHVRNQFEGNIQQSQHKRKREFLVLKTWFANYFSTETNYGRVLLRTAHRVPRSQQLRKFFLLDILLRSA